MGFSGVFGSDDDGDGVRIRKRVWVGGGDVAVTASPLRSGSINHLRTASAWPFPEHVHGSFNYEFRLGDVGIHKGGENSRVFTEV